eukprot:XP_764934.1 hypothetical protein [Theileria parva strain Muguga]
MNNLSKHEREELQHFINILYSFMSYKRDGSVEVERVYRSYNLLTEDDKKLLIESPAAKTIKMLKAIITNQNFIISMVSGIINFDTYEGKLDKLYLENENKYTDEDVIKELRLIVKNTSFCNAPEDLEDSEINPTSDPVILHRNGNWVRTTLRQFVRDWSDEGEHERNQCFTPLLDALKRKLPIKDPKNPPLILCPGCGLGRLPFEVLKLGYSSQGNEFSYFMLIDVSPSSFNFESHNFSICAGEFTEAYDDFYEYFDGILTCFFLDTAKNIISYIRTIAKIIKKGGLWANIGPLLYHYADLTHNSIELAWNEIEKIISNWFTIEIVEIKDANYTSNSLSMMKTQYKCIYFEAVRNDFIIGNFTLFLIAVAVATNSFVRNSNYRNHISSSLLYRNYGGTNSAFSERNSPPEEEDFIRGENPEESSHPGFSKLFAHRYKYVQVTLEKDTPNVGKKGEVVHVNRSFAFNYLVPFGFARYTTRSELVGIALDRDYKEALANIRRTSALQLKDKIGRNLVLEFQIPSSSKNPDELNAPLRPIHIIHRLRSIKILGPLDMLREQDVKIHTESGLITKFGVFKVTLFLDTDITSSIKVSVTDIPISSVVFNKTK